MRMHEGLPYPDDMDPEEYLALVAELRRRHARRRSLYPRAQTRRRPAKPKPKPRAKPTNKKQEEIIINLKNIKLLFGNLFLFFLVAGGFYVVALERWSHTEAGMETPPPEAAAKAASPERPAQTRDFWSGLKLEELSARQREEVEMYLDSPAVLRRSGKARGIRREL